MYDKKLKYKILSIFAAAVMTFTAITSGMGRRGEPGSRCFWGDFF